MGYLRFKINCVQILCNCCSRFWFSYMKIFNVFLIQGFDPCKYTTLEKETPYFFIGLDQYTPFTGNE